MEARLGDVRKQLDGYEVGITLAVLKQAKRFLVTIAFEQDSGMKKAQERVAQVGSFFSFFFFFFPALSCSLF